MSTIPAITTADAAERYLRRRQILVSHLEHVRQARARWAEYAAGQCLPDYLRREIPPPRLPRETVERLYRLLAAALARLDEGAAA